MNGSRWTTIQSSHNHRIVGNPPSLRDPPICPLPTPVLFGGSEPLHGLRGV